MVSAQQVAEQLLETHPCIDDILFLQFADFKVAVNSNSQHLIDAMRDYFKSFLAKDESQPDSKIFIFESTAEKPSVEFIDWERDPGKTGRKDALFDTEDGRFCWKVRTGMNYVLSSQYRIAYGPVMQNLSQAINFTINQHIEWIMNQGGLICHASAIAINGSGVALSAFSGGGKSTTALHLMNQGLDFVSNDRLFINAQDASAKMFGVAKQPRINPGTILNNETLTSIIDSKRTAELLAMPKHELWELEEKYDAMVDDLYGQDRFKLQSDIHAHVVLNWKHDSDQPTQLSKINIHEREDLLAAIMKSPGPFYMDQQGQGWANGRQVEKQPYLDTLGKIDVYEVSGKVDFDAITEPLLKLVKQS